MWSIYFSNGLFPREKNSHYQFISGKKKRKREICSSMEESNCNTKVCVTGGSGYIGSWLVKKLLEKGYTVHATLRNLGEKSKAGLLESLTYADTRLVLFQADLYSPSDFEPAIEGCHYVFHVATPMQHNTQSSKYKDTSEAAIAGVKSIAESCIRYQTVKRLIYTASVMASSPLKEDGSTSYKSPFDESCWTPLNLPSAFDIDFALAYTKSKTLAEKEVLSYNEIENGKLEVVSLACALVGGDNTLLYSLPLAVAVILSQLTGNLYVFKFLGFLQALLGSIPLVHIDDVCDAHIFCIKKESLRGRFLCAAVDPTMQEIGNYYQENYPQVKISEELMGGGERGSRCDTRKLVGMGFQYKYDDLKKILDACVQCRAALEERQARFMP